MKSIKLAPLLLVAGLAGCGGVAVEEPTGSGGSVSDEPSTSSRAGSGASPSGSSNPLPTHALGDCTPGFARSASPSRQCNWLTKDGICFDDKDAACNCICPASGGSVCFSGFGGPGSATLVQCL